MKRYFLGLAVVMLLVLALMPAECHAKGIFSFFNPEVTTPVTVKPADHSDIVGGVKATVTLGSLGSVLTSHLALIVFAILLYAALKRVDGPGYQSRRIALEERSLVESGARHERLMSVILGLFRPSLARQKHSLGSMEVRVHAEGAEKMKEAADSILKAAERLETAYAAAAEKSARKRGGLDAGGKR